MKRALNKLVIGLSLSLGLMSNVHAAEQTFVMPAASGLTAPSPGGRGPEIC